jgi:hypothetical protein
MPYKSEKINLHETQDRRIKLLGCQKLAIIKMYATGLYSINGLAKAWKVSKRLIQFILFPERQQKNLKDRNKRGGSRIYYIKDDHNKAIKDLRKYKQDLYLKGELNGKVY